MMLVKEMEWMPGAQGMAKKLGIYLRPAQEQQQHR
jgi:hypothetical protein